MDSHDQYRLKDILRIMFPPRGTPKERDIDDLETDHGDWPWRSSAREEQALNEFVSEMSEADDAINDEAYARAYCKGTHLTRWMHHRERVPEEFRTTKHTTYDDLERWGWSRDTSWEDPAPELPGELNEEIEHETGKQILWENDRDVQVDGVEYHATYAHFKNSYWPEWGVICADDNASPQHVLPGLLEDPDGDWYGNEDWHYTQLNKWSDVTFLTWQELCNNDVETVRNLNLILRSRVVNGAAKRVASAAMKKAGQANGDAPALPGRRFTAEHEQFKALMGTPNIAGIVFMLLQHEAELGRKVVSALTVFNTDPDRGYGLSILVELSWLNELPERCVGSTAED